MWSGALIYLVVLGLVARGDTQEAGRAGARYCSVCFLPEWESLDNDDDDSCSMRLSVGYYTALLSHMHSALSLQAMASNVLADMVVRWKHMLRVRVGVQNNLHLVQI